jgi:hypothetical protein
MWEMRIVSLLVRSNLGDNLRRLLALGLHHNGGWVLP